MGMAEMARMLMAGRAEREKATRSSSHGMEVEETEGAADLPTERAITY